MNYEVLRKEERAVFALKELYGKYGFKQYKMSKFEEYDLYVKNKDFLVSENIITFTDTDGKLMALKPDVTLSIIKNSKDNVNGVEKVFYNENVYRVSKGTKSFKEIMQVGLECLGDIDDYAVTEVLTLAVKSLNGISENYLLDVSSMDVVKAVMEQAKLSFTAQKEILLHLSEKNMQGVLAVCDKENVGANQTEILKKLVSVYGSASKIKAEFERLCIGQTVKLALDRLLNIVEQLGVNDKVNIDFSVINDFNYYNGIVFKGFISGIPTGILSGGQYDSLMEKMGKKSRAIGFAVYLDELGKLTETETKYDVDTVVVYGKADLNKINCAVNKIIDGGRTVLAVKTLPEKLKYKQLIDLEKESGL